MALMVKANYIYVSSILALSFVMLFLLWWWFGKPFSIRIWYPVLVRRDGTPARWYDQVLFWGLLVGLIGLLLARPLCSGG
jgi:hypothetical protein